MNLKQKIEQTKKEMELKMQEAQKMEQQLKELQVNLQNTINHYNTLNVRLTTLLEIDREQDEPEKAAEQQ